MAAFIMMMINLKRSATVKAYEQVKNAENSNDVEKKEQFQIILVNKFLSKI